MLQLLVPFSQLALLVIGLYLMYTAVVMTPPFLSGLAFTLLAMNFFLPMLMAPDDMPDGYEPFEGEGYEVDME